MTEKNANSTETEGTILSHGGGAAKVIGEVDDADGVGVLGNATGTGDTVGVKGEVDSPNGYGLYTPDDFRVDGISTSDGDWVVQVDDGVDAANVIFGHHSNSVQDDADGAVISGGGGAGSADGENEVFDNYGTISGGAHNEAGDDDGDPESAEFATVGGGEDNTATGSHATVGGGGENEAHNWSTVSGGQWNKATGDNATVGGGGFNVADHPFSTIGGGSDNLTQASVSTVGGGSGNNATANGATVGGGGGNSASGEHATVGGGESNNATNNHATVGGGGSNEASGASSTVPGGRDNHAEGQDSFAAGREAHAEHDGSFVVGDSTEAGVSSDGEDEVRFQHTSLFVGEGNLPTGTGTTLQYLSDGQVVKASSSARYKTNVEALSTEPDALLDLEPRSFEYEESGQPDVGLIAEEVADHVPELVLTDERGRPDAVKYDRLGVYLIAALRSQRERIDDLEAQNDDLAARLVALEAAVGSGESAPADD